MLIGIIGAMDIEVEGLKELMDEPHIQTISTVDFYRGDINGISCLLYTSRCV